MDFPVIFGGLLVALLPLFLLIRISMGISETNELLRAMIDKSGKR